MEKEVKKAKKMPKKVHAKDKVGSEKEVFKKKVDPIKDAFIAAQNRYKHTVGNMQAIGIKTALLRTDVYESMVNKDYVTLNFKSEKAMRIAQAKEAGVSRQVLSDAKICAVIEIDNGIEHNLWSASALKGLRKHALSKDYAKLIPMVNKLCAKEGQKQANLRMVEQVTDEYYNRYPDPKPVAKSSKSEKDSDRKSEELPVVKKAKRPVRKIKSNQDQPTLKARDDTKSGKPVSSKLTPAVTEKAKHQESSSAQQPKAKLAIRPTKAAVAAAKAKIKQGAKSSSVVANSKNPGADNVVSFGQDRKIDKCVKRIDNTFDDIKLKKFTNALEVYCDDKMQAEFDWVVNTPGFDDKDFMKIVGKLLKISKARKLDKSA